MERINRNWIRYASAVLVAAVMVFLSEFFNDREIIFPEIMALAVGAMLAPRQPWKVSKLKMLLLIALHSIAGIVIVRYIPAHMIIKIMIGFIISLISLYISKSTFAPLISATVLPIILETTSVVYPISAVFFTAVIILFRLLFEKTGLIEKNTEIRESYDFKKELVIGLQRFAFISLLAVPAVLYNVRFIMAPPLIVAFVEATSLKSSVMRNPVMIWVAVCTCGVIGCISRGLFSVWLGVPLWVSALIASAGIIAVVYFTGIYFPPAGAIGILPMLIDSSQLIVYPFETALGFGLMLTAAYFIRREKIYRSEEVHLVKKQYKAA